MDCASQSTPRHAEHVIAARDPAPRCPIARAGALAIALLGVALAAPARCRGQALGTDITNLNLCLYGDCEIGRAHV